MLVGAAVGRIVGAAVGRIVGAFDGTLVAIAPIVTPSADSSA